MDEEVQSRGRTPLRLVVEPPALVQYVSQLRYGVLSIPSWTTISSISPLSAALLGALDVAQQAHFQGLFLRIIGAARPLCSSTLVPGPDA